MVYDLIFLKIFYPEIQRDWWQSLYSMFSCVIYVKMLKKYLIFKNSHWRCSIKNGVLKNFANILQESTCVGVSFYKVAGLQPATLFKRDPNTGVFLRNFAKFLRTPFLKNIYFFILKTLLQSCSFGSLMVK